MKRSPQLTPLSHDHHAALEVALRLRRATGATLAEATQALARFWDARGAGHFALEERLLDVTLLPGDAEWATAVGRMRDEHRVLRDAVAGLDREPSAAAARATGTLLADHVRFEERQLFPLAERRLDPRDLDAIGRALRADPAPEAPPGLG